MILAVHLDKLAFHLSNLAPLIDQYQYGEPDFADNALKWLEEAEKIMSQLRLPEGSEMSALRSRIIKAVDVSALESKATRSNLRKARNVAAAEALERAESIMRSRLLTAEERLRFFEEKLCEGMTALLLQTPLPEKKGSYTEWLNLVWDHLRQEKSTLPLVLYITASLTPYDRSLILDRVLSRVIKEKLTHSALSG
jgi:hypothetical protein